MATESGSELFESRAGQLIDSEARFPMCGIAGVAGRLEAHHRDAVRLMCAAMRHRGPDDEGYFDGEGVSLGMRRLAIIDVAHGQQPVFGEGDDVAAVFNGEIYNYRELQQDLRDEGHTLASESDSECLPHLYEQRGRDMVARLRGMFALAVWDVGRSQLLLARDRVGKKPLFYWVDGPRIWFASELKCLLAVPGCPRQIDPVAVDHYLTYQYVPHPWSIIAGIRKLPPAHTLTWRNGNSDLRRYWQLDYAPEGCQPAASVPELAEQLRDHILEATRIRMVSERPLGAFLSGGLDSSAVVAAMARVSSSRVSTFSIGFEEEAYNELPYARRVAELYGTDHHELVVQPDVEHVLPKIATMFDEPFADSSAVPSYYVAEMARRDVVVVLNGDGGDECFGGYSRYAAHVRWRDGKALPKPIAYAGRRAQDWIARRPVERPALARLGRAIDARIRPEPAERYAQAVSYFTPGRRLPLYSRDFTQSVAGIDPYDLTRDAWQSAGPTDSVNHLLACDMELYLPGDLLPKVDITTMSVSLEARSPLLDQRCLEWAATLPGDLKVRGGVTKWLMKRAMSPWLPKKLIHREKMGFAMPREEWLRGPLAPMVNDTLLAADARVGSYLKPAAIRDLVENHLARGGDGNRVWALLMLELWHREVQER